MNAIPGEGGGTTTDNLVTWLKSHGFSVQYGRNITTDMIIENVKKGIPTIVAYNSHWLVAKGYYIGSSSTYKNQDEILFADSCCNTTVISRDSLDSTWQEAHMSHGNCGNNGDYIIAIPSR